MKWNRAERWTDPSRLHSLLLAVFFFLGIGAGVVCAGFFPAYAAGCLTASFGGRGLLLALAFFGFRCLVTVPCFFLLAAPAMGRAAALRGLSRGRRGAAFSACGRGCWLGFGIVCLILCLGAWIELRLSPFLLRALLERFF